MEFETVKTSGSARAGPESKKTRCSSRRRAVKLSQRTRQRLKSPLQSRPWVLEHPRSGTNLWTRRLGTHKQSRPRIWRNPSHCQIVRRHRTPHCSKLSLSASRRSNRTQWRSRLWLYSSAHPTAGRYLRPIVVAYQRSMLSTWLRGRESRCVRLSRIFCKSHKRCPRLEVRLISMGSTSFHRTCFRPWTVCLVNLAVMTKNRTQSATEQYTLRGNLKTLLSVPIKSNPHHRIILIALTKNLYIAIILTRSTTVIWIGVCWVVW